MKTYSFIITLFLLVIFVSNVNATSDSKGFIIDEAGVLISKELVKINKSAKKIFETRGIDVRIIITSASSTNVNPSIKAYLKSIENGCGNWELESNLIVLNIDTDNLTYKLCYGDKLTSMFSCEKISIIENINTLIKDDNYYWALNEALLNITLLARDQNIVIKSKESQEFSNFLRVILFIFVCIIIILGFIFIFFLSGKKIFFFCQKLNLKLKKNKKIK